MSNEISISLPNSTLTRRQFLATAGASALSLAVAQPGLARTDDSGAKINLGLIGCGGRGTWIADLFLQNGHYNLVAVADYFPDRAEAAGEKFIVDKSRRFSGLSAYQRLLEQKLDAVAIISPPYFHPEQAAAAVEAGKHVYCAKPIAVDVPGCQLMAESGRKATEKKQVLLIDFQTRAHPSYQEAVRVVHAGGIGKIISGEAGYQTGDTWSSMDAMIREHPNDIEARLRGWGADRTLSGDIITEQNIHALDVASWILDAAPVSAYGAGGRTRPPLPNGVWDNFSVIFEYPNDVRLTFSSKQDGRGWDDIACRVYGQNGTIDTHYFGEIKVLCDDAYNGGKMANLYTDGVVINIATFHRLITSGDYSNPTVAPSVRSNLTTILGRTAAYRRADVTWDEIIKANEKWEADLKGLKA
ncbi:MAG TPA: Gfo/Idh/MocA family oxidoreductase [Verrucomicrobiae bacterium]|jgi:predicted dehydrogenase|nr:Gfo/Idh/MocA family oxidoreductase [Verrucomicrobiae bacterium]